MLDPVTTFAYITRNHGHMVSATLYGMDGAVRATRQTVEGHIPIADTLSIPPLPVRGSGVDRDGAILPLPCHPAGTILATGEGRACTET
jgi:hypothetical protein